MTPGQFSTIVAALIAGGESFYAEFKSAWGFTPEGRQPRAPRDIADDIARTVVAFANAEGGDLLVGVEDSGQVSGIPHADDLVAYLVQVPSTQVKPDVGATVHLGRVHGQAVLLIRTSPGLDDEFVTSDGRCVMRRGARSVPVAPKEVRRRRSRVRGDQGYESEPLPALTLNDLDIDAAIAVAPTGFDHGDVLTLFQYWNLLERRNGTVVFRRAAALLFAREPLRWHPNNRIRIRRVLGDGPGFGGTLRTREREVLGPMPVLVRRAMQMLSESLQVERREESLFSTSQVLPSDAVDECLVNAVIHRNYAIEGQAIEVLLYPDRVEFKSPGSIPEPLSLDDLRGLKNVHRSRNPLIMRVMRDIGWARDQGEGMQRIFGAMRQVELHEPELEQTADTFTVRLSTRSVHDEATQAWIASYAAYGLQPVERKYLVMLREQGGSLSVDRLARLLDQSFDQAKRHLVALERKGIVWHPQKSRTYRVVEPLEVPAERAYRRVHAAGLAITGDTRLSREQLQDVITASDERGLSAAIDNWNAAHLLVPAGSKQWRFGPALLQYAAART